MKKRGFTLIELLAVIVILAVIAVIATPLVLNMIERVKIGALKDSAYSYMSAVEYYVASTYNDDLVSDYDLNGTIKTVSVATVKGTAPTGVNLKLENGKVVSGSISFNDYAVLIVNGQIYEVTESKVSITLVGELVVEHPVGSVYTDQGATAYDLIDEDITSSITTSGVVDINTIGAYTITYNVINSQGIAASTTRTVNVVDKTKPIITITGNNPYTHMAGDTYTDLGATATDNVDGNITTNIQVASSVVPTVVGTYQVTYSVADANGNTTTAIRVVNVIDTTNPTVSFTPSGDTVYKKTNTTVVNVSDNASLDTDTFKYLWKTNTTTPVSGDFSTPFTNGQTIATPAGATGTYYLWIIASDSAANTTITRSNVFNLDNTAPTAGTMTMKLGTSTGSAYTNNTWTNQSVWIDEVNGSDANSGHLSTTYAVSGATTISSTTTANTLTENGTYTITVTTTDNVGITSINTYTVKIDKTAPTAGTLTMKLNTSTGSAYTNNTWTNQNVWIDEVNGSDALSGHLSTTYAVSGATTISSTITANTLSVAGTSTVVVTTTDNAGNTSTNTYTVKIDKTAPVLTISGANPYEITVGETFVEPGTTASDTLSGVASKTNTTIPTSSGTYTITYTATDNANNSSTGTRAFWIWTAYSTTTQGTYNGVRTRLEQRQRTISSVLVNTGTQQTTWGYPSCVSFSSQWWSCRDTSKPCGDTGDLIANTYFYRANCTNYTTQYGSWSGWSVVGSCSSDTSSMDYECITTYSYR